MAPAPFRRDRFPLAVFFSMLDPDVARMGGPEKAVEEIVGRIGRTLDRDRYAYRTGRQEGRELLFLPDEMNPGVHMTIAVHEVERAHGRSQFVAHVWCEPDLEDLPPEARKRARIILETLAEIVVAAEEVEDVDASSIAE